MPSGLLRTFWEVDEGYFLTGESVRQRVVGFLTFIATPIALAALVYALSVLVALYAARLEMDAGRQEAPSTL